MVRKVLLGAAMAVGLMAAPAAAQDADSAPSVLPTVVSQAPAPTVAGVNLPRTGGDIDVEIFVGAGLTAAGLAFAVTARRRRQRFVAPAA